MTLSERELQKPYLPARADDFTWGSNGSMTRIESSFYRGDLDEMQQWLESGVLGRLMRRERKTSIDYHDRIPSRLLQGASSRLESPPFSPPRLDQQALEQWWAQLMSLRTQSHPQPISTWMHCAAFLPTPIVDEWVGSGISPHALAGTSSPFQRLLQHAFPLMERVRGVKGWPPLPEQKKTLYRRLDQWIRLPGMTSEQATEAMQTLSRYALEERWTRGRGEKRGPWLAAWANVLQDRGARCTRQVMQDTVLPAIAPRVPVQIRPGGLASLDQARARREDDRVGAVHQRRVFQWVSWLVKLPAEEAAPWSSDEGFLCQLLAMDKGHEILAPVFGQSASAWDTMQSASARFFHPRLRPRGSPPEPLDRQVARIKNLAHFVGEGTGQIPPQKVLQWAGDCIRENSGLSVQLVEAWMDCVGPGLQRNVGYAWARCCTFMSPQPDLLENMRQGLALLHGRNLMSEMLCQDGTEEGSVEDVNHFLEGNWPRWLEEGKFAALLCALPGAFGQRARTMQMFFVDASMEPSALSSAIGQALSQAPHLLMPALSFHLDRLTSSLNRRASAVQAIIHAMASNHARVSENDCKSLWSNFAIRTAPRLRSESMDMDLAMTLMEDLHAIAPVHLAHGEPMREWCKQERIQDQMGYTAQDPTIGVRWCAMQSMLEKLEAWGADFSECQENGELPFAQRAASVFARQKMDTDTPMPAPRARPRF